MESFAAAESTGEDEFARYAFVLETYRNARVRECAERSITRLFGTLPTRTIVLRKLLASRARLLAFRAVYFQEHINLPTLAVSAFWRSRDESRDRIRCI